MIVVQVRLRNPWGEGEWTGAFSDRLVWLVMVTSNNRSSWRNDAPPFYVRSAPNFFTFLRQPSPRSPGGNGGNGGNGNGRPLYSPSRLSHLCSRSCLPSVVLDKAPRLSIREVVLILPSDTETSAHLCSRSCLPSVVCVSPTYFGHPLHIVDSAVDDTNLPFPFFLGDSSSGPVC